MALISPRNWPQQLSECRQDWQTKRFCVLALHYPVAPARPQARLAIRQAIREFCQLVLDCRPEQVELHSRPGQPPVLSLLSSAPDREQKLFISISHEDRLSVAVISQVRPVGIDLVKIDTAFEWQDLAALYLPALPATRQVHQPVGEPLHRQASKPATVSAAMPTAIPAQPGMTQPAPTDNSSADTLSFFRQWSQMEALLKLAGLPLTEWSPQRQAELQAVPAFVFFDLQMPAPYAGTLCIAD